ncbi:hypothetical protein GCM10009095_01940 [Sphingomonas molluscorum]|nr:hypothetical protein GCM10017606_12380 [Microbacterium terregens]
MPPRAAAVEPRSRFPCRERRPLRCVSTREEEEHAMAEQPLSPGDDAAPGTPGTGENLCPRCSGSGQINGAECPECEGSGKVIEGIGGG